MQMTFLSNVFVFIEVDKREKTSENEANGDNESTGRWLIDALSILKSN